MPHRIGSIHRSPGDTGPSRADNAKSAGKKEHVMGRRDSRIEDGAKGELRRQMNSAGGRSAGGGKSISERSARRKFPSAWDNFSRNLKNWFSKLSDSRYSGDELKGRQQARAKRDFNAESGNLLKAMTQGNISGIKSAWEKMSQAQNDLGDLKNDLGDFNTRAEAVITKFLEGTTDKQLRILASMPGTADRDLVAGRNSLVDTIHRGIANQIQSRKMDVEALSVSFGVACYASPFQEDALTGKMEALGSGAVNTVYLGKYEVDGVEREMVFKGEEASIKSTLVSPLMSGIASDNPRLSERSLASSRLDARLGTDALVRTFPAMHDGRRGIVMEKALGGELLTLRGGGLVATETTSIMEPEQQKKVKGLPGWKGKDSSPEVLKKAASLLKVRDIRILGGDLVVVKNENAKIKMADPAFRRCMVNLQLNDIISGQTDRHGANYMVSVDKNGITHGVKGIDNDFAFGEHDLTKLSKNMRGTQTFSRIPALPQVVDREMFNKVMGLTGGDIGQIMGPSFTKAEVKATKLRLSNLQKHLKRLDKKARVIDPDDWGSERVGKLLTEKSDGRFTSYVGRDMVE